MRPWIFPESSKQKPPYSWAEDLELHPTVALLLWQRGFVSIDEANVFLSPKLRFLAPSHDVFGIEEGAKLLFEAVHEKKKVLVWGDYDADGITASCLVHQVLSAHGGNVCVHIPHREHEGYGLNAEKLKEYIDDGFQVLISVDCGISDKEIIAYARQKGLLCIITDHHALPEELPEAQALCNPRFDPEGECANLAGVGVAFFLMRAFCRLYEEDQRFDLREVLDLVALGTLADMVHLDRQNRIIAKNGLVKLTEAQRPGIAALKEVAKFSAKAALTASQVVFALAPRINAAGRLGEAMKALELLQAKSHAEARPLAEQLDAFNKKRREEEDNMFAEAKEQCERNKDKPAFVVFAPHWHQGIVGIVASRLVEMYQRPSLVLCEYGGYVKGSGRSVPGFDLHKALESCADLLVRFGGHKQAAGLTLMPHHLQNLADRFEELVVEACGKECIKVPLCIDAELPFEEASDFAFLKSLDLLQPFGMGNPEPVFASKPLRVVNKRIFGPARNHVSLTVQELDSGIVLQAKYWRAASNIPNCAGKLIRLAFSPSINMYNGVASIDLQVKDLKLVE